MSLQSSITKHWTLLRYTVETNYGTLGSSSPNSSSSNEGQRSQQRRSLDCSDGFLRLSITPTQQLFVTRDETEKIECVDLLTADSTPIVATYTGDSLLVSHTIAHDHIQRKFLVKFASSTGQSGRQHCEECVALLSRSITVTHIDATTTQNDRSHSIVTVNDMVQTLIGNDPIHLSSYYNGSMSNDDNQAKEFLEKYLTDETFPDFVASVATMLDAIKKSPSN